MLQLEFEVKCVKPQSVHSWSQDATCLHLTFKPTDRSLSVNPRIMTTAKLGSRPEVENSTLSCVCGCVCVYVCVDAWMGVWRGVCACVSVWRRVCLGVWACVWVSVRVWMCGWACGGLCVRVWVWLCVGACVCVHGLSLNLELCWQPANPADSPPWHWIFRQACGYILIIFS